MTTKKDDVLIKVEGLHKIYGDFHALNGIDEEIHRGEVVVIVGPSGSGKSTFLRSLNLLEVPDQGHIYFEGVDITDKHVDINKHRQKMGMVFQHFNLFPHMTVLENLLLAPMKVRGISRSEAEQTAQELLIKVGLDDKAAESPYDLSLSERKLLSVATVLAVDPAIYLFDEPMMSLDWESRRKLTAIFHQLADSGHQVVTITHDMDWVAAEFESVYVMEHGKFGFAGSPRELFSDHELVQRVGLLPPRIMDIAESLGDSQTYLSVNDYCQKNRDV